MGKVILWVIVIIGALLLTRILAHHNHRLARKPSTNNTRRSPRSRPSDPEPMVRCAHCSIFVPRSEAVLSGGKTWCCVEHAKLGPGA